MKVFKNGKLVYVIINGIKYIISNSKPVTPPEDVTVTSVSISNKISQLTQNAKHQLQVNVLPSEATDKSLTYLSSNTSIATVSTTGLITAKGVGSCTITVKSVNNITDTINLTVQSATIPVTGITVSPATGTLYPNQTTKLTVNVIPSSATNKNVTWTSLNTNIATVDSNGNVTAKAIGNTTIICTTADGGFTANYSLSVIEQIIDEDVSKYIYPNDLGLYATCDGHLVSEESLFDEGSKFYSEQSKNSVIFNSSEDRYYLSRKVWNGTIRNFNASVRSPIYILGEEFAIGDEKIGTRMCKSSASNTNNNNSLIINVEGTAPISSGATTDYSNLSENCRLGIATHSIFRGVINEYANPYEMSWQDIINYMNGKKIRWCSDVVTNVPLLKHGETIVVTGVSIEKSVIGLNLGEKKTINYTINPPLATNKNVIWTSSDETVVSINNGIITAHKTGEVNISVTTQEGRYTDNVNIIVSEPYTESELFKGAYVQMYYYEPKINLGTDLVIPFYISDDEQTEFYEDDYNKRFTLIVTIDGVERRFTGLRPGDQEINLGKLTEGEHSIVFQGIDESTGARGMSIYKEVWVVNPTTYPITTAQTYTMTNADLTTFGINNQNNDDLATCVATRDGLNNLWKWCVEQGYRKINMLPGTYRVSCTGRNENNLRLPSDFTIDGVSVDACKIKRKPNLEYSEAGISTFGWSDTFDSRIINITIEDDAQERIDAGQDGYSFAKPNGEGFNTIWFYGSRYTSIENCKITNSVGHGIVNAGGAAIGFMKPKYEFDKFKLSIINDENNTSGKFFIVNGEKVFGDEYLTSGMNDLKNWKSQYCIFGNNSGYSWIRGISPYVYFYFYDEDGDYVTTVCSMQYRPVMIPVGCRYVRYSIRTTTDNFDAGVLFYKEQGTHLSLSNNIFENCRTTAYAPTCSRGLLMENNNYVNCGRLITPSNVDFEDGWQQSIDVTYRNNTSTPHANSTADVITVCGINHVYENNDERILGKHYMIGCVYKNHNSSKWIKIGMCYDHLSRYNRLYDNHNCQATMVQWVGELGENEIKLKEKHAYTGINGGNYVGAFPSGYVKYDSEPGYKNNKTRNANLKGAGTDSWMINCNIFPQPYLGNNLFFEECNFYDFDNVNNTITTSFNGVDHLRIFNNCVFKSPSILKAHNSFNTGLFENCTFESMTTISPSHTNNMGDIQFNNCRFKQKVTVTCGSTNYVQFNNCTFENGYTLSGAYGSNVQINTTMPSKSVSAFRITQDYTFRIVAKTQQINHWITPANATNKNVIWTSSDETVATVNGIGLITAIKVGSCVITGRTVDGNYSATCNVTIRA